MVIIAEDLCVYDFFFFLEGFLRRQSDTGWLDFSKLIMTLDDSWANKTGRGEMRLRR